MIASRSGSVRGGSPFSRIRRSILVSSSCHSAIVRNRGSGTPWLTPWSPKGLPWQAPQRCANTRPSGAVQVWDSGKHPTTPDHPHQHEQSRDRSSCALGTPDFFPDAFSNVDHHTSPPPISMPHPIVTLFLMREEVLSFVKPVYRRMPLSCNTNMERINTGLPDRHSAAEMTNRRFSSEYSISALLGDPS